MMLNSKKKDLVELKFESYLNQKELTDPDGPIFLIGLDLDLTQSTTFSTNLLLKKLKKTQVFPKKYLNI